ncbi:MAG TPA: PDZ domain-containing protein [Blastocatellia bacterium]|nr:PDZ domain-containing protein [Blastocatellia bacterium]
MEQTWFGISNKVLYSIIAVILLLWGLSGLQEITKIPYDGFFISPDNIVTDVQPGSPTAVAGLRVGDEVTKIDGIPVESVAGFFEHGRPVIGSPGSITVKRGGGEQTLQFRYAERPTSEIWRISGASILVGLASLLLGLMVYLRNPTWRSNILCLILFAMAAVMLPRPYVHSSLWNRLLNSTTILIMVSLVALFLVYCLNFPRQRNILRDKPWLSGLIAVLALAMGLIVVYINLFQPDMTNTMNLLFNALFGLVLGGMMLWGILAVAASYFKADASERRAWGLNWMMLGLVIGLLPPVLAILIGSIFPRAGQMPWMRIGPILALAIPLGFALALMKREPVRQALGEEARA